MNKNSLFYLLLTMFVYLGFSQSANPYWANAIALPNADVEITKVITVGPSISTVKDVIVIGNFKGSMTLGTSLLASAGGYDVFVANYDTTFSVVKWAYRFGGPLDDFCEAGILGGTTNVFLAVNFQNTASFGSTNYTSAGGFDVALVNIVISTGNIAGTTHIQGTGSEYIKSINRISGGHTFLAGYFENNTVINSTFTLSNAGNKDMLLLRTNGAMTVISAKRFGSSGEDVIHKVVDSTLFAGHFSNTLTIGTATVTSYGNKDGFLFRSGTIHQIGGTGQDEVNDFFSAAASVTQFFFITGTFENTANFKGYTITSKGGKDIFLAKLDNNKLITFEGIGSTSNDEKPRLSITPPGIDRFFTLSGMFRGNLSIQDKTITGNPSTYDGFVATYAIPNSYLGTYSLTSVTTIQNSLYSDVTAVQMLQNQIFVAGRFENSLTLGSHNLSTATYAGYLARYRYPNNYLANKSNFYKTLDVNELHLPIYGDGMTWEGKAPIKTGGAKTFLYNDALWIGGLDASNQLHVAAEAHRNMGGVDFVQGPVQDTIHYVTKPSGLVKAWKFKKSEIDSHIVHFNNAGYVVPENIATYPGNGNTSLGQAAQLLPYFDANNNGIYEPALGDYPLIKGDQAVWAIFNDAHPYPRHSAGEKMGIEVHLQVYGYNCPDDTALYHTAFYEYNIINRSTHTYHDVFVGKNINVDLGNSSDDQFSSDSARKCIYFLNLDNYDEPGVGGYGTKVPAVSAFFSDTTSLYSGIIYNEGNYTIYGVPTLPSHYYNYLKGKLKDGSAIINPVTSLPTTYMYSGDVVANTGWNYTAANSYISGVISSYKGNFAPGQKITFTTAYSFAQGDDTKPVPRIYPVSVLQSRVPNIRNKFVNNLYTPCTVTSIQENALSQTPQLKLYPNPAQDMLHIEYYGNPNNTAQIRILDLMGREIYRNTLQNYNTVSLNTLPDGMYVLQCINAGKAEQIKFVVQR